MVGCASMPPIIDSFIICIFARIFDYSLNISNPIGRMNIKATMHLFILSMKRLTAWSKPEQFSSERCDHIDEGVALVDELVDFVVFIVLNKLRSSRLSLLLRSTISSKLTQFSSNKISKQESLIRMKLRDEERILTQHQEAS